MISVYVWLARKTEDGKNVGHASMKVGNTYMSWWPDETAGLTGDFYPIRNKSFRSDCDAEGCTPDHTIYLDGLNEKTILDWWAGFGLVENGALLAGPLPRYNLTGQNCSSVVATGLKKGGGDKYARWNTTWSVVWRPQTVLDYARSIKTGLEARKTLV